MKNSKLELEAKQQSKHYEKIGQKYHYLTVIDLVKSEKGGYDLLCKCDCGNIKVYRVDKLLSGRTKSCSCYTRKLLSERNKIPRKHITEFKDTRKIWLGVKYRCLNPKYNKYRLYGGRGITISPEWMDFEVFLSDMGERPSRKYSIERIDSEKGYSKQNCKWATSLEQARNRRDTRYFEFGNCKMKLPEWANFLKISFNQVSGSYRPDRPSQLTERIRRIINTSGFVASLDLDKKCAVTINNKLDRIEHKGE